MTGIILPADVARRIIEYRCACGAEFYDRHRGIRHAAQCTKMDDAFNAELEAREANPITSRTPADAEAWQWGRKRMGKGLVGFKRGRPT